MDGFEQASAPATGEETDVGLKSLARPGSLLSRTAMGAGWIIGWRLTSRFLGLLSTLVLARLLTPSDFGIVSLVMSFLQGINTLSEVGVNEAIMRADRTDRAIYDSGFTINAIRAVATSLLLVAAAVPLAQFFGNPHLIGVIIALSFGWAVSGFGNIGLVDFRRYLAFDLEFKIKILPRLVSIGVAIPLAFFTHSYWALVSAIVASQIVGVGLSYYMHPYRPRFSFAGMNQIAAFSFWMWVKSLIGLIGGRFNTVYIGRVFGTAGIGIFGVGEEVATLASAEIVSPLCTALFAGFAEARREGGGQDVRTLLRVHALMSLITFPLSFGLSLVAYPVIKLGFGAEWLKAVPLVEVLAASATFSLFGQIVSMLFTAHALIKDMAARNVITMVLRIALVVLLVPYFGLLGAAIAAAAVIPIGQTMWILMAIKGFGISLGSILADAFRPFSGILIMAIVLNAAGFGWSDWAGTDLILALHLAMAVALGAMTYSASVFSLWLLAGRPTGAETDALLLASRMLERVVPRR